MPGKYIKGATINTFLGEMPLTVNAQIHDIIYKIRVHPMKTDQSVSTQNKLIYKSLVLPAN